MTSTVRRDPATDEEFLAQLYKGGELLAAGKVTEAKDHLERAFQLHPKNEKAQNLLGLTYFKLGLFERASEIYELLVNDNPADPTLRVNLGLVYLKTNNLMRSVREFETATDLEPGHKKAHNYLGLALAQAGDYARAREHFVISGSEAMADKMARAMVSAEAPATVRLSPPPSQPPAQVAPPAVTAPPPPGATPPRSEDLQIEMMSDEEDVPAELDAPAPVEEPSPVTLVAQAHSMGGADGPPLPQAGFEELPDPRVPAPALHSDWGAQFGIDADGTAGDGAESAATSEAAVATGMQVPSSVMVEASSSEMPLVDSAEVIEATIEEVEVAGAPVVMVEQNVLVPVEDQGALAEQPLPSEAEPMVAGADEGWGSSAPEQTAEEEFTGHQAQAEPVAAPPEVQWVDQSAVSDAEGEFVGEAAQDQPTADQQFLYQPAPGENRAGEEPVSEAEREFVGEPAPGAQPLPAWVTGEAAPVEPPAEQWAEPEAQVASYQAPLEASSPPEVQPGFQAIAVPKLSDLGPRLDYGHSTTSGPFHVGPEGLAVTINGEMLSRLTGLVAVVGGVDAQPEARRNRGRPIDQTFGEGASQLQRVKGYGTLYLEPGKASFQAIDLDDEGCYLREERVFAFEEAVAFENGRLTSGTIAVDMVHLKGHGAVLLRLEGALKAMAVPPGTPLKVPLVRLVGWYGQVSPRVMMGFVGQATVELTGEGYALLAAPG